ncbi:hypothetical protein GC173_00840 [bacterium]|nr:hypothetical protein [bacterium]
MLAWFHQAAGPSKSTAVSTPSAAGEKHRFPGSTHFPVVGRGRFAAVGTLETPVRFQGEFNAAMQLIGEVRMVKLGRLLPTMAAFFLGCGAMLLLISTGTVSVGRKQSYHLYFPQWGDHQVIIFFPETGQLELRDLSPPPLSSIPTPEEKLGRAWGRMLVALDDDTSPTRQRENTSDLLKMKEMLEELSPTASSIGERILLEHRFEFMIQKMDEVEQAYRAKPNRAKELD